MASLGSCQAELASIVAELESIQAGIAADFSGIGQEHCASSVGKVADKARSKMNLLNSVDPNNLAEWFLEKMGLLDEEEA